MGFRHWQVGHPPTAKQLLCLIVVSFFILLFSSFTFSETLYLWNYRTKSCSPQAYAEGSWSYHPRTTAKNNMSSPEDALAFSGFEKWASSREYYWHLASESESDREDQWDRFPGAQSWEWIPRNQCKGLKPLNPEDLVRTLVEDGVWYLVGGWW